MSTIAPPSAPQTYLTVFSLHRYGNSYDEIELFHTYDSALASLAGFVRNNWDTGSWRDDPDSPAGLSDAEVVLAFYGGDGGCGGRDAPTYGQSVDHVFTIAEEMVTGAEPAEVSLRLATLRVFDDAPVVPDEPMVTYWLEAAGLAIKVSHDQDGYPVVVIVTDEELAGMPVTVRVDDPFAPIGGESSYQVS